MKNIVFISGATASGKSSFAHKLIDNYFNNAAIISIDSIQVYRYMDIGSAKPSLEEIKKYNYKMVDILEPSVNFNIKEYLDIFKNVINSIDNVPIFGVGGTGFYIDAIKYGIFDEIIDWHEVQAHVADNRAADGSSGGGPVLHPRKRAGVRQMGIYRDSDLQAHLSRRA